MPTTREKERWTLYVCPDCGGYGQNNLGIHLKGGRPPLPECDVTEVREVDVVPASKRGSRDH